MGMPPPPRPRCHPDCVGQQHAPRCVLAIPDGPGTVRARTRAAHLLGKVDAALSWLLEGNAKARRNAGKKLCGLSLLELSKMRDKLLAECRQAPGVVQMRPLGPKRFGATPAIPVSRGGAIQPEMVPKEPGAEWRWLFEVHLEKREGRDRWMRITSHDKRVTCDGHYWSPVPCRFKPPDPDQGADRARLVMTCAPLLEGQFANLVGNEVRVHMIDANAKPTELLQTTWSFRVRMVELTRSMKDDPRSMALLDPNAEVTLFLELPAFTFEHMPRAQWEMPTSQFVGFTTGGVGDDGMVDVETKGVVTAPLPVPPVYAQADDEVQVDYDPGDATAPLPGPRAPYAWERDAPPIGAEPGDGPRALHAGQVVWYDETADRLRVRDADDQEWVELVRSQKPWAIRLLEFLWLFIFLRDYRDAEALDKQGGNDD